MATVVLGKNWKRKGPRLHGSVIARRQASAAKRVRVAKPGGNRSCRAARSPQGSRKAQTRSDQAPGKDHL